MRTTIIKGGAYLSDIGLSDENMALELIDLGVADYTLEEIMNHYELVMDEAIQVKYLLNKEYKR